MAVMNNKYVRFSCYVIIGIAIFHIIRGIKTEIENHNKEIFEYPIYEALDDPTVILVKFFTDVCIIVGIIFSIILRKLKNVSQEKHKSLLFFGMVSVLFKCFDMLLFVVSSFLFMHGILDEMFQETSSILMFAVFHSIGYLIFVPISYFCVNNVIWKRTYSKHFVNKGYEEGKLEDNVLR